MGCGQPEIEDWRNGETKNRGVGYGPWPFALGSSTQEEERRMYM